MKDIKTSERTVDSREPKEIEYYRKKWFELNKEQETKIMIEQIKNRLFLLYFIAFWATIAGGFLYLGYWLVSKALN